MCSRVLIRTSTYRADRLKVESGGVGKVLVEELGRDGGKKERRAELPIKSVVDITCGRGDDHVRMWTAKP